MQKLFCFLLCFLLLSCTRIIFQPDRVLYSRPSSMGFEVREEVVESFDSTKLGAWFLHSKPKPEVIEQVREKTLVIFFHGNAQNISAHFSVISWMSEAGIDVFLGDYRGYGISEGEPEAHKVVEDTRALLDKGYEYFKKGGYQKLVVYSQSLGGALTISALRDFKASEEIDLLVLDATFKSPKSVAHDKIWGLGYLLVSDSAFAENLNHLLMPTLVIHGTHDQIIPQKFGDMLFSESSAKEKWQWILPGVRHIETFHFNQGFYRKKFISFLNGARHF